MEIVEALAEGAAIAINRRRFLRRLANGTFFVAATAAAGGGVDILRATVAWATDETCCEGSNNVGLGCPSSSISGYPCGPSRCCNYIRPGAPNNCDCGLSGADCKTNTQSSNCYGRDKRDWSLDGCWTCRGPCYRCSTDPPIQCRRVTTCCDCKTNADHCNDPDKGNNRGRCISYSVNIVENPSGCTVSQGCP